MSKKLVCICIALLIATASQAGVIGNWEDTSGDGWQGWSDSNLIGPMPKTLSGITYNQSGLVSTLDDYSLEVSGVSGWGQQLAISLNSAQIDDYMANYAISFDFIAPPSTTDGWNEIYAMSINVEGFAWSDLGSKPLAHFDYWNGSGLRVITTTLDYSAFKPATKPGWVQFIFALNGDVSKPEYIDNVQLIVPEPATIALLGLGGLALLRRKK